MDKKMYNLTYPQKNIWLVEKYNGKTSINSIIGTIEINNNFDENICKEAINYVIKNNDALRINICEENGETLQYIRNFRKQDIKVIDMTNFTKKQILDWKRDISKNPIEIYSKKLYECYILKYTEKTGAIYMKMHHLTCDAWSCGKMVTQAIKYIEKKLGNIQSDNEKYCSYIEYIKTENEYINSDKYLKDENFWKEYLEGIKEPISLKESPINSTNANRYSVLLSKEMTEKINVYCKENRISQYTLFLAALSTYLYRVKNNNDFVLGTPVLNRSNYKEKNMVGMFVSTLPIRIKIEENIKFIDLAKQISSNTLTIFRHQKYPYFKTLEHIHKSTNIKSNLYNIILSYQNARADLVDNNVYSTTWPFTENSNNELQIHITDLDDIGEFNINYDYISDFFEKKEIEYLHNRILSIIRNAIDEVEINIEEIQIIDDDEKKYLLKEVNNNTDLHYYERYKSIIDTFEEQVCKNPDGIALVFEEKEYTYFELNKEANKLADYLLKEKKIKPNNIVTIAMKRSEKIIISMLAILKLRAAYLLIDTSFPENRILDMLEGSQLIITDDNNYSWLKNKYYINLYNIDLQKFDSDNKCLKVSKEQLDYIIYTSGTTGKPKGIMISDKNLLNFCVGINKVLKFNKENVMLSITTISFDIFGLEVWLTLLNGGKIILANEEQCINQKSVDLICNKYNVNTIQTTPTKFKLLTSDTNRLQYISNMKNILIGGEKVPSEYVKFLKNYTGSKIFNVYGPSETTIWSTIKDITQTDEITVGKPIQNTHIYILDQKSRILPINVKGELCIGGDSVSSGYYNRQDLTEKSFIHYGNEIIYRTGDMASIDFNGDVSIYGRIDNQIKLNGQRIELEEIETQINKFEGIGSAVVVKNFEEKLVCFYTLKNKHSKLKIDLLKNELMKKLPIYMIPNHYMCLEGLPQTLNNKIDRKCLINYKSTEFSEKKEILMPQNDLQNIIYDAWKTVIKDKEFGIKTNFFELGTDSLDAIKVQIELMSKDIKISYDDLQKYQTITTLEEMIRKKMLENKISNTIDTSKRFSNILSKNNINDYENVYSQKINKVILTGVTGFLGIHILDRLLKENDCIVYCLIREKNGLNVEQRLREKLNFFYGKKYDDEIGKRIIPIKSDIIKNENFDVEDEDLKKISENIDFIVHAAACVKHYGEYDYFYDVNVRTTTNVAKFALKNDIKLIHISTISVSGNSFEGAMVSKNKKITYFDETMLYNGQDLTNVYVNTKFKAEEFILEYMNKGLKANILRIGNLTSRTGDFKFQPNIEENAFVNRLKSFITIGMFPKDNIDEMYVEFTPVDIAAKAVEKIMKNFNINHNMFHIFNHNHVYLNELLKIFNKIGINIEVVDNEKFIDNLKNISVSNNKEILAGIINDLDENYNLDYAINVKIKSDLTVKYLKSIGFEWNNIEEEYVIKFIESLKKVGFINF